MNLKSPLTLANPTDIASFPRELHLNILTFLRATDLSALQRACRCFNHRDLVVAVVDHYANEVYPSDLTKGFDTPIVSGEVRSVAVVAKKGTKKSSSSASTTTTTPAVTTTTPSTDKVYTYEMLRNMEMLVVARVLSRPEPPVHERDTCFYVSKSWCRAALRWLEVQEVEWKESAERRRFAEEQKLAAAAVSCGTPKGKGKHNHNRKSPHPGSSGKKKLSRKEQRQRDRRMSDAMPPWSNINNDIVCEHGSVKQCSSKSARARRRVMDKQAWKVLKCLYPDSIQLEANKAGTNGCLICAAEDETAKKAENDKKEEEKANRKKPLECPFVRGFYTRGSKGYPLHCLVPDGSCSANAGLGTTMPAPMPCPLKPGVYCALPRSWCHQWRKYIKTGEGKLPPAPDASEVLCDAHNSPLVPPHLESFLRGETSTLLGGNTNAAAASVAAVMEESVGSMPAAAALSRNISASDAETLQALRAAGLSEVELHAQRVAMAGMERDMRRASIHDIHQIRARSDSIGQEQQRSVVVTNEQLDRENRVVVEILTDEEVTALEKWWPRCHGGANALRFAVVEGRGGDGPSSSGTEILWSNVPCRECDPSSRSTTQFVVRNRLQKRGYRNSMAGVPCHQINMG
mmetsp:Transcript_11308/g.20767  ORF Transcript_11308/g.20767 Transcript_11308/m.20767 type:complete len:630 (+) Transcript_11308:473-2362(+)|eukprot:CAMPEP_0201891686 /NCGR_PEP_ID=MMETSP0902-20130614/34961_1 /ASSEMBLY_ACC=CAM_ASM_000551 /TAXON_ID=420261 /ORGANISM="Thalassiosira antarctica, Strain CCMP982" /LENGTH=629 /DNA_ID=CAMNT_0048422965 /DNA_START=370 /DNA_END=2259 /DNA_ORIENTATION=+